MNIGHVSVSSCKQGLWRSNYSEMIIRDETPVFEPVITAEMVRIELGVIKQQSSASVVGQGRNNMSLRTWFLVCFLFFFYVS